MLKDNPVESSEVRELDLGDVITVPETDLQLPARVVGISDGSIGARFIDVQDVETGELHHATLCLNSTRIRPTQEGQRVAE